MAMNLGQNQQDPRARRPNPGIGPSQGAMGALAQAGGGMGASMGMKPPMMGGGMRPPMGGGMMRPPNAMPRMGMPPQMGSMGPPPMMGASAPQGMQQMGVGGPPSSPPPMGNDSIANLGAPMGAFGASQAGPPQGGMMGSIGPSMGPFANMMRNRMMQQGQRPQMTTMTPQPGFDGMRGGGY